jgi:hypothetical protein
MAMTRYHPFLLLLLLAGCSAPKPAVKPAQQMPPMPPGFTANVASQLVILPPPKQLSLVWTDPNPCGSCQYWIYYRHNLTDPWQFWGISTSNSCTFAATNYGFFAAKASNVLTGQMSDWATR